LPGSDAALATGVGSGCIFFGMLVRLPRNNVLKSILSYRDENGNSDLKTHRQIDIKRRRGIYFLVVKGAQKVDFPRHKSRKERRVARDTSSPKSDQEGRG
jgi:hypothetical protein